MLTPNLVSALKKVLKMASGTTKSFLRLVTPPGLRDLFHFLLLSNSKHRFVGPFEERSASERISDGYANIEYLNLLLRSTLRVQENYTLSQRDGVVFSTPQIHFESLSCIESLMIGKKKIQILDVGGGFAQLYFQNRIFFDLVSKFCLVEITIIEQEELVKLAKRQMEFSAFNFLTQIPKSGNFDLLYFGSSIPYLPNLDSIVAKLSILNFQGVLIDRTPISRNHEFQFFIEKPPRGVFGDLEILCRYTPEAYIQGEIAGLLNNPKLVVSWEEKFQVYKGADTKGYFFKGDLM